MLQSIHDKSKSWISIVIIVILILAFAFWGVERIFVSGSREKVVAKVNGVEITQSQFASAYGNLKRQWQQQLGAKFFDNPKLPDQLKQSAMKTLVRQTVLRHTLNKQGYNVSPQALDQMVYSMPFFQVNGQFSSARFQQAITSMGYTESQFLDMLKSNMITDQVRSAIVNSTFVLPNEVAEQKAATRQQRQFTYATVSSADFIKNIKVSSAQIEQYYQQHQAQFKLPEEISIDYIELSPANVRPSIKAPTAAELQQYYQQNSGRYDGKTYQQVASQVRTAFMQQALNKAMSEKTTQLGNLTLEQPGSLQPAAKALGLTVQSTDLFTRAGEKTGILKNAAVVSAAFGNTVLEQESNSDVIDLPNDHFVVLRLKQRKAASVKPLADVRATIEKTLTQQQADKAAQQFAQGIVKDVAQGKTVDQKQLSWQDSGFVTRQDTKINNAIVNKAFLMPLPTQQQASVASLSMSADQYAIIDLKAVKAAPLSSDKQATSANDLTATNAHGQMVYQIYQDGLVKQANVKYYEENIKSVQ
ncbi:MAG: SurA N-terminal domain-containing protein [Pseudomonadota bacterium]